jgi:membrane-associated phospholipid phosphatase
VFDHINSFARQTGWLHAPLRGFAAYGVVLFGLLVVAGWWLARGRGPRTMAAALWAGAGTLLAVAVNQPLVNGFHEARPYTDHPHLLVLATRSADYSFPSDHAVMAGAVAAGLWLVDRRLGLIATAAALVMAFARVYIAAHYPHDVLVGLAVGAGAVLLGWALLARPLTWLVTRLTRTPLRPLLASTDPGPPPRSQPSQGTQPATGARVASPVRDRRNSSRRRRRVAAGGSATPRD